MSEVLVEIEAVVDGPDNKLWVPRLCGATRDGRMWDGWFEFTPVETLALPVRTAPVTEQPTREALLDWATRLTYEDIAEALSRTTQRREARSG